MKKNMKKIIVGMFSLALLFSATNVFAVSIWNTASNDCRTVSIANQTTGEGHGDPCWPGTNITAQSGQSVNVRIYYHNNSTSNATNTRIILNAQTGASSSHSFSGQIVSDQGSTSSFTVSAQTPSGSTLKYVSTKWLPNRSQTPASLPYGQNGAEVLSGGLNIGTVASGWETQGSVVVVFSVIGQTNPPATTPTGTLIPANNSCSISLGQNSCQINFTWNTQNPTGTSEITKDGGSIVATGNSGSKALTIPYNTATFRLRNNAIELDTATVTSSCTTGTTWDGSKCAENVNPSYTCSVTNFTVGGALSSSVSLGNSVNLAWSTTNCSYVNITGVGNNLPANGSQNVYPTVSTTYTLTGHGSSTTSSPRSVSVTVNSISNPTYTCTVSGFTVNGSYSDSITSGEPVTLAWTTNNCNSVSVTPSVGSNLDANGSYVVYPTTSTTYRITGSGTTGLSQSRTVSVVVSPNVNPAYSCMITDFKAENELFTTIEAGDPATLAWTTQNCYTVDITPNVGSGLTPNNSHTVYPTTTTTYRLTAKGTAGSSVSRTVKVTVIPKVEEKYYCSIVDFETDDNHLSYDDDTTLRWETDNCHSVSISNIGTVSTSGSRRIYPSRSTNYILTAYGTNGVKQTRSLYITVGSKNYSDDDYCSISNFSVNQNYINAGSPVTLSWNTNDCDSVNISGLGSVSSYGNRTVYPSGTTNYLLTAYGEDGESIMRSVSVIVNSIIVPPIYPPVYPPVNPPVYNSCAVTTVATNINQNGATLNGLVSGTGGSNTYFEYGTTVNLGSRTNSRSYSGNTTFSETISGLSSNTIYYYRFVSNCQGGTNYGSIEIFRTLSSQVVRPVIIQGTTVTGAASPVMLKIENRYEAIGKGDFIEYIVTYKNIGKSTLHNPILQVITREGIIITNSSRGTYSPETKTLTVELDDLISGEEGVVYVQGYVKTMPLDLAKIVTTALLVYTNTNDAQENAIAYVLNIPRDFNRNSLGAAVFLGGFWGIGLIGWLLIIILILLIILIIRRYFYRPAPVQIYNNPGGNQH